MQGVKQPPAFFCYLYKKTYFSSICKIFGKTCTKRERSLQQKQAKNSHQTILTS